VRQSVAASKGTIGNRRRAARRGRNAPESAISEARGKLAGGQPAPFRRRTSLPEME
jgi:hypothetical protein